MQVMGFSGEQVWVEIIRQEEDNRGASLAKAVSIRDERQARYL
jgi:hypothetical protein